MTTILPTDRPMLYCVTGAGDPITGTTHVGELTGVNPALSVVADADENAFVAALPADAFPPLPESGWLEADVIYSYEGGCVMVRQSHNRTIYAPAETPALFIVYRPDAGDVLEWVAGESVLVGTLRTYEGDTYRCIQSHVTQADWTPDATPALWTAAVGELAGEEWQPWTAYAIDGVVSYDGTLYKCRQAHTSQPGWEPPNVPALWETI